MLPWHCFVNVTQQIHMESVYFIQVKASKSKEFKHLPYAQKIALSQPKSGKKNDIWATFRMTKKKKKSIKGHLQKSASQSTTTQMHVCAFTFAAFLRASEKMYPQYFPVKPILVQKHSSSHLTSLVMQGIHLNLIATHTLWCSLIHLTDLISCTYSTQLAVTLLLLIYYRQKKVSTLDRGFLT